MEERRGGWREGQRGGEVGRNYPRHFGITNFFNKYISLSKMA